MSLVADGNRALDSQQPEVAAPLLQRAIDLMQGLNVPSNQLLSVMISAGTAWIDAGEYSRAERVLRAAEVLASQAGNDLNKAEVANGLAGIHLKLGRYEEARIEFSNLLQRIRNYPAAEKLIPALLDNLASSELRQGQYRSALQHQQSAVDLWRTFLPADHPSLIKGYTALATIQYLAGEFDGAHLSMETAIKSAEKTFGEQKPIFARLLQNEIVILTKLGLKRELKSRERQLSRLTPAPRTDPGIFTRAATAEQSPIN